MTIYEGRLEKVGSNLKDDGQKYGLSVGRRSPMHRMHVECLEEIIKAGLTPVMCFGSANNADSRHYNPINTPLTMEQQKEQLRIVLEKEFPEQCEAVMALAFAQEDVGNAQKWSACIANKLKERNALDGCVMHFRAKDADCKTSVEKPILPLSRYGESFAQFGISVWQSHNDPETEITLTNPDTGKREELSAGTMRNWDLQSLTQEQRIAFAAPDYIIRLAIEARENNPDRELIKSIPVTMLDLSLERMRKEAHIPTRDIIEVAQLNGELSLEAIKSALNVKLEEHIEGCTAEQQPLQHWQKRVVRPALSTQPAL